MVTAGTVAKCPHSYFARSTKGKQMVHLHSRGTQRNQSIVSNSRPCYCFVLLLTQIFCLINIWCGYSLITSGWQYTTSIRNYLQVLCKYFSDVGSWADMAFLTEKTKTPFISSSTKSSHFSRKLCAARMKKQAFKI